MWNKLSYIFVFSISSSIFIPSFHYFCYCMVLFCYPICTTFADIIIYGESLSNIVEIFQSNSLHKVFVRLPYEEQASFISFYKVLSAVYAILLGIYYAIKFTSWFFCF